MIRRAFMAIAGAALLATGLTLSIAQPASANHGTISGVVSDSGTGLPLDNVCITLGPPIRCWTSTNASGTYLIDLRDFGTDGQTWDLYFLRTGFQTQSKSVVVNGPTVQNVAMVSNAPAQPVPSATPVPGTVQPAPPAAPAPPRPTYTVYLPNITKTLGGSDGWHTPFIVQNVGTVSTDLSVSYYGFADGALVKTRTATVLPGRSHVESPRDAADLPGNSQFSVVITSAGAPVVAVVNQHQGPGAGNEALSYSGLSSGSSTVHLPIVSNMVGGWLTTLIMQNVGTTPATINASLLSLDGTKTATVSRTVSPGRSAFIDPRFETSLQAGVEYSATFTSSQPIAVVANNHNDLPGTQNPMGDSYNGISVNGGGTTYLPYVMKNTDGVGRTSRVIVQNAGSAAAMPTISLTPFGGGAAATVTAPSIPAGGAWAFTPPTDGEYSLTISGGAFAAVSAALSPLTAMFSTSNASPVTKLFMPNVTRRLTAGPPDPGWNTPILIQSATATSATLNWYKFADGTLAHTQTVSLTPSATTRVDPAAVAGLADNSQYAVVLESTGTLVSLVTQLNLVGGDAAMVYGGFAAPQISASGN